MTDNYIWGNAWKRRKKKKRRQVLCRQTNTRDNNDWNRRKKLIKVTPSVALPTLGRSPGARGITDQLFKSYLSNSSLSK